MKKEYLEEVKRYLYLNRTLQNSSEFGPYSKLYSMTTENIAGFLNNYNLNDKNILSVAGSGDQLLNAYLMGAKNVTCFDINPLAKLQLDFKSKAIQLLDYDEFLRFFGLKYDGNHEKGLQKDLFNKIKDNLEEDTYDFFNYVINKKDRFHFCGIYYGFNNNLEDQSKFNNYLKKENYLILKEILKGKNINFIESDINSLCDKLDDNKYDLMLLSNISDYIHIMYNDNPLYHYRQLIDRLEDNLNIFGTIQVGYIYSSYHIYYGMSNFHYKEERQKYFPADIFPDILIDSCQGEDLKDKVITYQKLK